MEQDINKIEEIEFIIKTKKNNISVTKDAIKLDEIHINDSKEYLKKLDEVKKLLIRVKNNKIIEKKDFILTTINTALADVFIDKNVRLDILASNTNQGNSKLNLKYDIVIFENDIEMGRNEKLLLKIGGGVMSFISILFKILVGFLYSKNKLYVFDESLAEVSELYRPRMAQWIKKFCEVHGFTVIIITQTSDIAEYSDVSYLLDGEYDENDVPILKIEKIINKPEDNYYYSKIENFQSIVKLEFRYKGFTSIIGKNSIGKSASFRAINSILYNNFDMKEFPRIQSKEKQDKQLNSYIEFGKFTTKGDPSNEINKISLRKKGASLIFTFDNLDYVGKNLSFEKVKEKIESIGFKYLNLKEQYKNFKGNLKDQTERLAITTQQDGYYLIGDKASDSAKIFDFLFDSREVTSAILKITEDIQRIENEILVNTGNIHKGKRIIEEEQKDLINLNRDLKLLIINEILYYNSEVSYLNHVKDIQEQLIANLQKILMISIVQYDLESFQLNVKQLEDYEKKLLDRKNKLEKIVKIEKEVGLINNLLVQNSETELILENYSKLHTRVNALTKYIDVLIKEDIINNLLFKNDYIEYNLKKLQTKYSKQTQLLDSLLNKLYSYVELSSIIINLNNQYAFINETNKINVYNNTLINFYNKNIDYANVTLLIENINLTINNINYFSEQIENQKNEIESLPSKYHLSKCTSCQGTGFHFH